MTFRAATRMPERKNICLVGDVLEVTENQCGWISRRRMTSVRRARILYGFHAFRLTSAYLRDLCVNRLFNAENAEIRGGPQR